TIKNPRVDIVGEWAGKNADDYYQERIMLHVKDKGLKERITRGVRIVRMCYDTLGNNHTGSH
ncbi:unnamed protein product, partial [marine sediment metagenome]